MNSFEKREPAYFEAYLKHKQSIFSQMESEVIVEAGRAGDSITCRRGCVYCCHVYVEATIQECRAVAYYLQQNRNILDQFLQRYPGWLEQTEPFRNRCTEALNKFRNQEQNEAARRELSDVLLFYRLLNSACPFLKDNACSIYQVRPFVCAAHFASGSPDWCSCQNAQPPKIYKGNFTAEITDSNSDNELTLMPEKVYELIRTEI